MVATVDIQQLSWTIYNNINNIIDNPPVAGDDILFTELRDSLLSDAAFVERLRVAAEENGIDTTTLEINIAAAQTAGPNQQAGFADHLLGQLETDNIPMMPDLVAGYHPSADFSIANLQELQASEFALSRDAFEIELTNLNPRFAEFFENVADSDGWVSDDAIVSEVEAALNGDPAALSQLIEIAGDDARMDALVTASATDAGRASFSHVLEAASPIAPVAPQQLDVNPEEIVMAAAVITEEDAPATDLAWSDDEIFSTFEALKTANPETISGMSEVTQEAFGVVQNVVEIETQLAQYNLAPHAYEGVTPTIASLEVAENAAYDYLAALSPADGQTVLNQSTAVVEFDAEAGITPLTPAEQGGQEYLAEAGLNSNGTNTLAAEAAEAFAAAAAAEEIVMSQTVVPQAAPIDIDTLSREDLRELLLTANENGGADYETYKQSFIALNSDYQDFFDGLETQGGQAQTLLVGALNNPESQVLETMVGYADDPASLQAMTAMVTDDGSDFYFLADERQMSDFLSSLARENGMSVLTAPDGNTNFEVLDNGQIVAVGVEEFSATIQTQLDVMIDSPEVIVPEGTALPDNIPDSHITRVTPEGTLVAPTPDEIFEAPAEDVPSPATITEPFLSAALEPIQEASVDSIYTVERGDALWNIAQEQYGLTSAADIMRATAHIARANGLENGVDANHIDVGQELAMPSADQIGQPIESLNWTALDNDPTIGGGSHGYLAEERIAAAPQMN